MPTVLNEWSARGERFGWACALLVGSVLSLLLLAAYTLAAILVIVWVGLPLLLLCVAATRLLANGRRWWAGRLLGIRISPLYLDLSGRGLVRRATTVARDPSTWTDLLWLAVDATLGLCLGVAALVESILGLLFWWLPRSVAVLLDAHLARALLTPRDRAHMARRIQDLTASRADTVDTQAAELRRIERDLHDGAQARLVALGMSLGLAEAQLDREGSDADPTTLRGLLSEARTTNAQALADLRRLVRGIHPPVLSDRGLTGAVQALVLTVPIPVEVRADVPRLPAPLESAAYFAVAEALANIIKHSGADRASVDLVHTDGVLRVQITDDGRGGARLAEGGGLRGMQRRLAAFDGRLGVSSPQGGPTTLTVEVPCASS